MTVKSVISPFVPQPIWRWIRLQNILREHNRTAKVWNFLIDKYDQNIENQLLSEIKGSAIINSEKVVWQYWAQGYEEVPELVSLCLKSVDKFCQNCKVIRLSDSNIRDYLDLPDYLYEVSEKFGLTFFADLLRSLLVKVYGGVWLDATVLLTAPLPETYFRQGVFMFQRDSEEKHKE